MFDDVFGTRPCRPESINGNVLPARNLNLGPSCSLHRGSSFGKTCPRASERAEMHMGGSVHLGVFSHGGEIATSEQIRS